MGDERVYSAIMILTRIESDYGERYHRAPLKAIGRILASDLHLAGVIFLALGKQHNTCQGDNYREKKSQIFHNGLFSKNEMQKYKIFRNAGIFLIILYFCRLINQIFQT
jgi:hypothetical protein